jgi:hypothetical protein
MFVPRSGPRYTEEEARRAVAESKSWAETLRNLGMCTSGGAAPILRKYVEIWGISTDHFDPYASQRGKRNPLRPLSEVLVENSTYSRGNLKERLFREGYKPRYCELCGQGEEWQGRRMSLILDHVTASGMTTGSTTSGSSALTARRHSTRIAAAGGRHRENVSACCVASPSGRGTRPTVTAARHAASARLGRPMRSPRSARSTARRMPA